MTGAKPGEAAFVPKAKAGWPPTEMASMGFYLFAMHVDVRTIGFIRSFLPPVICLILPGPHVPSSTRTVFPAGTVPGGGSCFRTCALQILFATKNAVKATDAIANILTCFPQSPFGAIAKRAKLASRLGLANQVLKWTLLQYQRPSALVQPLSIVNDRQAP